MKPRRRAGGAAAGSGAAVAGGDGSGGGDGDGSTRGSEAAGMAYGERAEEGEDDGPPTTSWVTE